MEFVFSMLLILQGARSVLLFQRSITGKKLPQNSAGI